MMITRMSSRQRGATALAVALVLLFGMTLVAFFANRGLIFEQRTSANQYRATRAFEMAEAGLEWAGARLNDTQPLAAAPSCAAGTTQSYGGRYLPIVAGPPAAFASGGIRSGCSVATDGTTTCRCPTAGDPAFPTATDPRFTVVFTAGVGGDPWLVEVTSFGCTSETATCDPASAAPADAIAVVRTLYKMVPSFPQAPGAGLITGSQAITGGNLVVVNQDVPSNGITIHSGTTVTLTGSSSVITLPGTPPRASILDNDPSLQALTTADSDGNLFFTTFFGEGIAEYKNNATTWILSTASCGANTRCTQCSSSIGCGTALANAYTNNGAQRFWSDHDITFNNSNVPGSPPTLGSPTRPISLANTASTEMKGNITAYGMYYAQTINPDADWEYEGSGTAKVIGAFVSRGDFRKGNGTLDVIYDPKIFQPENTRGLMVRVPGSWRDKTTEYN